MLRAVSLAIILSVLLCACSNGPDINIDITNAPGSQPTDSERIDMQDGPQPDEEKPGITEGVEAGWTQTDAFFVFNVKNTYTANISNIYDINGNLLKTIYAYCPEGFYTKDDTLRCFFYNEDAGVDGPYQQEKYFNFKTGDFSASGYAAEPTYDVYSRNKTWDQIKREFDTIRQKLGLIDDGWIYEHGIFRLGSENGAITSDTGAIDIYIYDYFAVVSTATLQDERVNDEHELYCFHSDDFVDLNIPDGYGAFIQASADTNYAIVQSYSSDYSDHYYTIIDMYGRTRYNNNKYFSLFANDFIRLSRGNYSGIADLDGNWVVKTVWGGDP